MRNFLRLYELMQEWSEFNEDPLKCSNWNRKAELEQEIKKEFKNLTLTKVVKFASKVVTFISKFGGRFHEKIS